LTRRALSVTGAAAVLWVASCAPAMGASARVDTVSIDPATTSLLLVYQADPGELNTLTVGLEPDGWYRLHNPGATIAPGARCEPAAGGDVRCFANTVEIRTGDMNDSVSAGAGAAIERISGGDGNDTLDLPSGDPVGLPTLMGGDGDDVLHTVDSAYTAMEGGPGADQLVGGTGADTLDGGTGSDRISGGAGVDTLANADRPDGVTVDLAQGVSTAAGGERDELSSDIENVRGGVGPDVLTGTDAAETIHGGAGDDTIHGAGGNDTLAGDAGNDSVNGDSGNDTLFAGSDYSGDGAPNSLSGGSGRDELVGGSWKDVFDGGPGTDTMDGQGGHDVYMARDGEFDWVRCGSRNRGTVVIDVLDFQRGCGRVSRSGAARGVFVYGELHPHKYDIGLACPADMPRRCEGTYRLVFSGGRTHAEKWSLQPRQASDNYYFETKLSPAEQRALSRTPASSIALRLATRTARGRRVTTSHPFPGPPITAWPGYAAGVECEGCPPDPPVPTMAG
jgi:Ca2+-binding RTX toxin-like protein